MLKHALIGMVAAALVVAAPVGRSHAKGKAKAASSQTQAQKARGGGADENVKNEQPKNDPKLEGKLPGNKGGEKSRQAGCTLHVDNRTQWIINQVFVDGDNVGGVGRGGDGYSEIGAGSHTLYARAFFDDGSTRTWGPMSITCSGSYNWRLLY